MPDRKSRSNVSKFIIPLLLFLLFSVITLSGLDWGLPDYWHPDELIKRVILALNGEWQFDEINYDYPSLPKYVMYGLGQLLASSGADQEEIILGARVLSVIIGGVIVSITYALTRSISKSMITALTGGLLIFTSSELAQHARYAHNDIYLALFGLLVVMFLLNFMRKEKRMYLYWAFFSVGLAASSKYNGGSLLLAPIVMYLFSERSRIRDMLRHAETLFIGIVLSFLGYAFGTPKALLWLAYYVKRIIPALIQNATYDQQSGASIGLFDQWGSLRTALGWPIFIVVLIVLIHTIIELCMYAMGKLERKRSVMNAKFVILVALIALDLPIAMAYNYPPRFFLPLIPFMAVLTALSVEDLYAWISSRGWAKQRYLHYALILMTICILLYSGGRMVAVRQLFVNDSRIAASDYIATLPIGTNIEYTLYPPTVDKEQFEIAFNYPIFFYKFPGQEPPADKAYEWNIGEQGVEERKPDYIVIDSFTYERFNHEFTCQLHQVECDFFRRLLNEEANYALLEAFEYRLPSYLPEVTSGFLNPDIRIYSRNSE